MGFYDQVVLLKIVWKVARHVLNRTGIEGGRIQKGLLVFIERKPLQKPHLLFGQHINGRVKLSEPHVIKSRFYVGVKLAKMLFSKRALHKPNVILILLRGKIARFGTYTMHHKRGIIVFYLKVWKRMCSTNQMFARKLNRILCKIATGITLPGQIVCGNLNQRRSILAR